jgi:hypothetical protein
MAMPPPRERRLADDLIRTAIFLFGMGMGAYFLFAWRNVLGIVFGLVFLIAGGRNMRAAWFPYGRLVESLFWLGIYGIGFLLVMLVWAMPSGSDEGQTNTVVVLIGALLGYSLWDTYRSIRFIVHVLKMREKAAEPPNDQEPR